MPEGQRGWRERRKRAKNGSLMDGGEGGRVMERRKRMFRRCRRGRRGWRERGKQAKNGSLMERRDGTEGEPHGETVGNGGYEGQGGEEWRRGMEERDGGEGWRRGMEERTRMEGEKKNK